MQAETLSDRAGKLRHELRDLEAKRVKATEEYEREVSALDADILERRHVLADFESFFEFQHQRDGGGATIGEVYRTLDAGNKLSPHENALADAIQLHVPVEQQAVEAVAEAVTA